MNSVVKPPCWAVCGGEAKCSPHGPTPDLPSPVPEASSGHPGIHPVELELFLPTHPGPLRAVLPDNPRHGLQRGQAWPQVLWGPGTPSRAAVPCWLGGTPLPVKCDSALCPNAGVAFLLFAPKDVSVFTQTITAALLHRSTFPERKTDGAGLWPRKRGGWR